MEKKVADFVALHGIFAGAARILVAVSGGADSVSLLHVLKTLRDQGHIQAELVGAHVNHRLRDRASDDDERFVVEHMGRLDLPVVTRAVDVRTHAKEHKLSLETAGRQLRLAALAEIARQHGCSWVATGHHRDDNAETLIHRLRRGTGFRGLAGIRPVRPFGDRLWLARPLLCATRDEILRYLCEHNLSWREDHTNADVAYTRNYIRHTLLPSLQQDSQVPLVEALSDLALAAVRLHDRVRRDAEKAWDALAQSNNHSVRIDAAGLAILPEMVAIEVIRHALVSLGSGERDLTERHYRSILHMARRRTTNEGISLPAGFSARYESGGVVLRRGPSRACDACNTTGKSACVLAIPGSTRCCGYEIDAKVLARDEIDIGKIADDKGPYTEYLDWDRIESPVVMRRRLAGDRFEPLGLGAAKKIGKFLTTAGVPRQLRERVVVLADQEKVIWVCPVRIAESVKLTEQTQRILALTVLCV